VQTQREEVQTRYWVMVLRQREEQLMQRLAMRRRQVKGVRGQTRKGMEWEQMKGGWLHRRRGRERRLQRKERI